MKISGNMVIFDKPVKEIHIYFAEGRQLVTRIEEVTVDKLNRAYIYVGKQ